MALPTMSPSAECAPLQTNGKRKREYIDLTEDEDVAASAPPLPQATTLPTTLTAMPASPTQPPIEEGDGDSMIEDYADHFEMAPYQNGNLARRRTLLCRTDLLVKMARRDSTPRRASRYAIVSWN